MDIEETMVEQGDNAEAVDTLPEDVVEEQGEPEESLDSLNGEEEAPAEQDQKTEPQGTSEPGWFRKRWDKEVGRLSAQIRSEVQAEYEAQIAPLRERMMEMDAQELLKSRKVADIETARELVRLRNGLPAAAAEQPKAEQPRQTNGQFAPKEDAATTVRINMLKHQADAIRAKGGPDVIAEFQSNEEIKRKVINGEMDFYEVADYLREQKPSRKRAPSPTRSPNGASGTNNPNAIDSMSDEQFDRMERRIKEGARYKLK